MTDGELKEKVIEKLDLTNGLYSLEWIDLLVRMREKAKRLGWQPGFSTPLNEPDGEVYYFTVPRSGRVLKDEDYRRGLLETAPYSTQEYGLYQAEALAFLDIFNLE